MNSLERHYKYLIRKDLIMRFNYVNTNTVPLISKISINLGLKEGSINKKKIISSLTALELLAGQHPIVTKSKKAIANFNLKANQPIGAKLTLQKKNAYNFMLKYLTFIIYFNKSFTGVSEKNLNNTFNLGLGVNEMFIFPEISQYYENFDSLKGMDIMINTTARNKQESLFLLSSLRTPLR